MLLRVKCVLDNNSNTRFHLKNPILTVRQTGRSGLCLQRYLQHGLDAIPGDLYADAEQNECDHAQDAMSSLRRNKCRDDPARSLAEVDTYP